MKRSGGGDKEGDTNSSSSSSSSVKKKKTLIDMDTDDEDAENDDDATDGNKKKKKGDGSEKLETIASTAKAVLKRWLIDYGGTSRTNPVLKPRLVNWLIRHFNAVLALPVDDRVSFGADGKAVVLGKFVYDVVEYDTDGCILFFMCDRYIFNFCFIFICFKFIQRTKNDNS
jgi:hypothetical protein